MVQEGQRKTQRKKRKEKERMAYGNRLTQRQRVELSARFISVLHIDDCVRQLREHEQRPAEQAGDRDLNELKEGLFASAVWRVPTASLFRTNTKPQPL